MSPIIVKCKTQDEANLVIKILLDLGLRKFQFLDNQVWSTMLYPGYTIEFGVALYLSNHLHLVESITLFKDFYDKYGQQKLCFPTS